MNLSDFNPTGVAYGMLRPWNVLACAAAMVILIGAGARGENVDLVTLPDRETVQLTIYNSEDLTLVKETRQVTLKKGENRLQFSWAGTLIDPTSVELRPLAHADQIDIADTVFPGQKPQHLIWNLQSEFSGQVPVEVSYFTSGLTWQMDYVAVSNPDETAIDFRGYVRVHNQSGEPYENAHIRLIVGTINLVEKIAELARHRGIPVPAAAPAGGKLRLDAMQQMISQAEKSGGREVAETPKQIVKEGVSEYFMFTVDGEETIADGWSKRMRAVKADDVRFDILYRTRAYQYGPRPVRFFIWRNDPDHRLGDGPLPNGLLRVFRDNGREGLSYLGQQVLNYVPIKAEIEINLGPDDLVVYQRRNTGTERLNFAFHPVTKHVTGWDERQTWTETVKNFREKPIRFELRLQFGGDVEFAAQRETTAMDYQTVQTVFDVAPRNQQQVDYGLQTHHGTNAKQNRVRLKPPQ